VNSSAEAHPFSPCCKDLTTALSFPAGRHLFIEDGKLKLLVAKTPLEGGGEAELENAVRYCPFCGQPTADLFAPKSLAPKASS
jgi:hypothetical protein